MKRRILLFAAVLVVAGCSSKTQKKNPTSYTSHKVDPTSTKNATAQPVEKEIPMAQPEKKEWSGYKFQYGKHTLSVNDEVDKLVSSLGEPKKKTEYETKAFVGKQYVYEYDGMKIATYPGDTKDYVQSIMLTDPTISTEEGIKVGASQGELESAYGDALVEQDNGIWIATLGNTKIRFILLDGKVAAIDYFADVKNKVLSKDKEAPDIVNPFEITVYRDQKDSEIDYYRYTTAKDEVDVNARVIIDTSSVNKEQLGEYNVKIYAYDRAGNKSFVHTVYTVADKAAGYTEPEKVDSRADKVLEKIIHDGMSTTDKCTAIYKWIRGNFNFVDTSDKTDWVQAANTGLKRRSGDCFVYYAVAQELLYRSGIQSMRVQKNPGYHSTHYWSLVYVPEQGWYHFDTTPRRTGGEFNLVTDRWLLNYSARNGNSHDFNTDKYPATPKKDVEK